MEESIFSVRSCNPRSELYMQSCTSNTDPNVFLSELSGHPCIKHTYSKLYFFFPDSISPTHFLKKIVYIAALINCITTNNQKLLQR